MASWVCKRCETANSAEARTCEVCGGLMLYTHEEVEQLLAQRMAAVRAEVAATMKPPPPPPPTPAPVVVTTSNCDGVWFLVAFLTILLVVLIFG